MKKRTMAVFFTVVLLLLGVQMTVFADSEFEYEVSESGAVCVKKYKGDSEKAEIPEKTDDGYVTVILSESFKEKENLKSLVIPESMEIIEENAFEGCGNLKDVYFKGSVEKWESIVKESKGNESFLKADVHFESTGEEMKGNEFFEYIVNGDKEVVIRKGRNDYKENTKITFPSKIDEKAVTAIADGAFEGCKNLCEISFENGIKTIGQNAFRNCSELKKISLPDSVEKIGRGAFDNTAFYNKSAEGSIYISKWYCGCKGDMSKEVDVRIQRGTKGIADYSFYGNPNIVNVFFAKGIKYIGDSAFGECKSLSGIFFEGTKSEWKEIKRGFGNDNIIEKNIRYNMTIDNYWADMYKDLSTTLLVIMGILIVALIYCVAKIIVLNRMVSYLDEELSKKPLPKPRPKRKPAENKRQPPKKRD